MEQNLGHLATELKLMLYWTGPGVANAVYCIFDQNTDNWVWKHAIKVRYNAENKFYFQCLGYIFSQF